MQKDKSVAVIIFPHPAGAIAFQAQLAQEINRCVNGSKEVNKLPLAVTLQMGDPVTPEELLEIKRKAISTAPGNPEGGEDGWGESSEGG
jgi:hypothetical protein